jgi:ABC-type nitrate/sulfonate/bicarbonate transport system substrate-binding protein
MRAILLAAVTLLGLNAAHAQDELPTVNWGYISSTAYYWDGFAAIERGFAQEEGVKINAIRIDSAAQAIQTLVTGAVDIVSVPAELVISSAEKGADVVAVANEVDRPSFALVGRPEIKSFEDLRGKSIAVTQLNEAVATMVRLQLAKHGVAEGEYDLVALGATPNRYAALTKGAVAAAVLSQPTDFKAVADGNNHLGYTFEAFDGNYLIFATTRTWAGDNKEALTRFLRATVRGSRWLYDTANRDAAIDILVKAIKATPEDAAKTYDLYFGSEEILTKDLELDPARLQPYLDLRGSGEKPERFVDLDYLKSALKN